MFLFCFSHVINELIETERVYVEELFTVLMVSLPHASECQLLNAKDWERQCTTCCIGGLSREPLAGF